MTTDRHPFLRNLATLPFEVLIAVLAVLAAVRNFTPAPSLFDAAGIWGDVWSSLYGLGGLAMIVGIGRGRRNVEAMGLVFLVGGVLVQAFLVLLLARGAVGPSGAEPRPFDVVLNIVTYVVLIVSVVARLQQLYRGDVVVRVKFPADDPEVDHGGEGR